MVWRALAAVPPALTRRATGRASRHVPLPKRCVDCCYDDLVSFWPQTLGDLTTPPGAHARPCMGSHVAPSMPP